ncbi:MAG TPA: chemotaxis protein CheW [Polyangiaceae bacterium]
MRDSERSQWLLVESGGHACALPLACVRETMRPLPLERLGGVPNFVLGLAVIRGSSVPVVDLAALLERPNPEQRFGRFLTLAVNGREVALAVEAVRGVSRLENGVFDALPPLLGGAGSAAVKALALHDSELLLVLEASRLVPDESVLRKGAEAS